MVSTVTVFVRTDKIAERATRLSKSSLIHREIA